MCCMRLAENTGCKISPKIAIWAPSHNFVRLRHVSTIGKKLVKQQYVIDMSAQYGELQPTKGWDLFGSLGHPSKFERVSRLGSVTARQSSSERQPNFAALNRGRHLCSAGRPSRWALAHISSYESFYLMHQSKKLVALQYKLAQKRKASLAIISQEGASYFTR